MGNAKKFKTGGWRSVRPLWDGEKCSQCLLCFILCPDSAIKTKDAEVYKFDYDFCKGCGICAYECPRDAITMIDEGQALKKESANRESANTEADEETNEETRERGGKQWVSATT